MKQAVIALAAIAFINAPGAHARTTEDAWQQGTFNGILRASCVAFSSGMINRLDYQSLLEGFRDDEHNKLSEFEMLVVATLFIKTAGLDICKDDIRDTFKVKKRHEQLNHNKARTQQ